MRILRIYGEQLRFSKNMILQSNPGASYFAHKTVIDEAVQQCLESRWYILGAQVKAFESEFSQFLQHETEVETEVQTIGAGSGTDALQLALRALDVSPGDIVFAPSHTAVATVTAIDLVGAIPRYVDIDLRCYTLSAPDLKRAIAHARAENVGTPKAIIAVHLYGQAANLSEISQIARDNDLLLIEDCAQAHGATHCSHVVGTLGDAAEFSFYPTKNLGALGDGGALVSRHEKVADKARLLREYGWKERYVSHLRGMNTRLDELQAAILRVKLPHLRDANARRGELAALYAGQLGETGLTMPHVFPENHHVWHQFVVRVPQNFRAGNRDDLQSYLKNSGIGSLVHYPVPVHLQPAYAAYATRELPQTQRAAREVLSLPMYPELSDDDALRVVQNGARLVRARIIWGQTQPLNVRCNDDAPLLHLLRPKLFLRGLTLFRSLQKHAGEFVLWVLCCDEVSFQNLQTLDLPDLRPVRLAQIEAFEPRLAGAKANRNAVEYLWTLSPVWPLYLLEREPQIEQLTYLDADLFFYASPAPIFEEIGAASIAMFSHRLPPQTRHMEVNGIYNVGWLTFARDQNAFDCLRQWREQCLDWCYDRCEDGKYGDQAYLDAWPRSHGGVHVIEHEGAGIAPWNWGRYHFSQRAGQIGCNDAPLIFFHFHGLRFLNSYFYDAFFSGLVHGEMPPRLRNWIFGPYLRAMKQTARWARARGCRIRWGHAGFRGYMNSYGTRILFTKLVRLSFSFSPGMK